METIQPAAAWGARANWCRGPRRAVGGRLYLTGEYFVFVPNSFEGEVMHEPAVHWPRSQVTEVDLAPRRLELHSGAIRRRLRLTFADGEQLLFVVPRPKRTARRVASIVEGRGT